MLSSLVLVFTVAFSLIGQGDNNLSIQEYNHALPLWGTTWAPGNGTSNGYYPSFYTGFAMRSEFPNRIHVRLARGNQTRVTVVLDEQTISDYLFDLVKRYEFYKKITTAAPGAKYASYSLATEQNGKALPQLDYFNKIIESANYGILSTVNQANSQGLSSEALYLKSLSVLSELNSGRIFMINLNLTAEFMKWKQQIKTALAAQGDVSALFKSKPQQVVTAINSLAWGRVNYAERPSSLVLQKLMNTAQWAAADGNDENFLMAALDLFKTVTGSKYNFRVVNKSGQWQSALQCANLHQCFLSYPEFTAIYPTGTVMETTKDQFGNVINSFTTPGLWRFVSHPGKYDVDNIRDEPYYQFAPKMDYEAVGNGFHNPSVRFNPVSKAVKTAMGIPTSHNTLEAPKRGGVSHGCSRLALGHIWEMRQIFPVENQKMTQINFFGSAPQDFDVYDVYGDGKLEVMGVEYLISYDLQGTDGLAQREGSDLRISDGKKLEFYNNLYGAHDVFTVGSDGKLIFNNPSTSMPSYLDDHKRAVSTRMTIPGALPLYEQIYEKDKVQFYVPTIHSNFIADSTSPEYKQIARLVGRVRGCAPTSDKNQCGEAAFDHEAQQVLQMMGQ
jgi:hypothetical protein